MVELVQVPQRNRGSLGRVNMEGYLARVRGRRVNGNTRLLRGRGRIGAEYDMCRYPSLSLAIRIVVRLWSYRGTRGYVPSAPTLQQGL